MSKISTIAALIGAALVGAVVALVVAPQIVPPGLLPGIGAGQEASVAAEQPAMPAGQSAEADKPGDTTPPAADSAAADSAAADSAATDSADSAAIEAEKGEVIAMVDGENLYEADLSAFIQQLPPQLQAQVQMLMPQILDQLVNNQLTTAAGRTAGLSGDREVQRRVGEIEDLIIGQTYLQRAIDERVSDATLETAYQEFVKENPPQRQLKARHILVETEEAAKEVIVALDGGADFAELAKERSTGPSSANGGDLPPFKAGEMVPEFSDAAFAMDVGTHSKEPVKTQFGWHVIKLEESTMTEPPAKEAVEQQLRGELEQQAAASVYDELRAGARIEILFGKPKPGEAPAGEAPAGEAPAADAPAGNAPAGEEAPAAEEPAPPANN
jgi:peptidyl-prolyl cis-trans isomerase C